MIHLALTLHIFFKWVFYTGLVVMGVCTPFVLWYAIKESRSTYTLTFPQDMSHVRPRTVIRDHTGKMYRVLVVDGYTLIVKEMK
jgi:hypothetical protein